KGHSGLQDMIIPVVLSIPQTTAVTATWATADLPPGPGDATSVGPNRDYVATSGTVTFAAGQTTAFITVQVVGNTRPTGNLAFLVNLTSASSNVALGRSTGVGTIVDDNFA